MAGSKARDNKYYEDQLRREYPQVYRDFLDGKYPNLSKAREAAGTKKVNTPLLALERAWARASQVEKDAFRAQIGCSQGQATGAASSGGQPVSSNIAPATVTSVSPPGNVLLDPSLRSAIQTIMDRRKLTNGQVMAEIGYLPSNTSMSRALRLNSRITTDLAGRLAKWIRANGA